MTNVMNPLRILLGLMTALLLTAANAQDFVPVPKLTSPVMDLAGMLNPGQRAALENVLREYETRTGNQIAILLINSTAPEAIEQYSIRVVDEWKLGRKGVDDGVLLLVAKDNPPALRRLRIEAGRGVQGVLTDAQSKRVLQDVIAPHFRQNDFYGGLAAGISAITGILDREQFPVPEKRATQANAEKAGGSLFSFLVFMVLFIFLLSARSRGSRNQMHRGGWGRSAPGIILGGGLGGMGGFGGHQGGFGGGGFGGFSGGGGGFDGGGASGNW